MKSSAKKSPWLALLMLALAVISCNQPDYFVPPRAANTPAPEAMMVAQAAAPSPLPEEPSVQVTQALVEPVVLNSDPLPTDLPAQLPTSSPPAITTAPILYYTQAADTLPVVAVRFGVSPDEITSPDEIEPTEVLPPNQLLIIPRRLANTTSSQHLFADSEVVYSPSAVDFDIEAFINQAGGYLSTYKEWLQSTKTTTGAAIIKRVALENSINPRLLLALLEYQSHWVYGQPMNLVESNYPMGLVDLNSTGLYKQLVWAVNHISTGYYAYREGRLTEVRFSDGLSARLAPDLNAGTAALQYYFAQTYAAERWLQALDMKNGLPALHEQMFGNPWLRAQTVEPLYPPGLTQPALILPFQMDRLWSFSGGPHGAWEHEGSYAALDFAPASSEPGCQISNAWVTAMASGQVVRSGNGVVVLDLDGDGFEQTGWVLLYLHVSSDKRAPVGTWVDKGDVLGHPSCEGGQATGTHVHIARKYNGEWIQAAGPMPFVLSGWTAHAGQAAYKGTLTRGDLVIEACTCGSFGTRVIRTIDDPFEAGN
jgi:LasA protease